MTVGILEPGHFCPMQDFSNEQLLLAETSSEICCGLRLFPLNPVFSLSFHQHQIGTDCKALLAIPTPSPISFIIISPNKPLAQFSLGNYVSEDIK